MCGSREGFGRPPPPLHNSISLNLHHKNYLRPHPLANSNNRRTTPPPFEKISGYAQETPW